MSRAQESVLAKEVMYCLIQFPKEKKWDIVRKNSLRNFDDEAETATVKHKCKNYDVEIILTGKIIEISCNGRYNFTENSS